MFNKSIKLEWKGQEYIVPVTFELSELIDHKYGLFSLIESMSNKAIRVTEVAKVISTILNEGGASTTPEEIWEGMGGAVNTQKAFGILGNVITALLPPAEDDRVDSFSKKKKPAKKVKT